VIEASGEEADMAQSPYTDANVEDEVVAEMIRFYGADASRVAAKNIELRRWSEKGRRFWFRVWKRLSE
jgi:hypothetical protein